MPPVRCVFLVLLCGSLTSTALCAEPDPQHRFRSAVRQSAHRGANWLARMQKVDGLFTYGWIPSLNRPMAGDNHLRQAGAAVALARAAACTKDESLATAARQAITVLLTLHTAPDSGNPGIRKPTLSPTQANPVGFAGLLLLAISELPRPTDELLEQGEGLARFLQSRQRADGSINIADTLFLEDEPSDDPISMLFYPGEALYALMRNYSHRPSPWKLEMVNKAFGFYRSFWKQFPDPIFVPWQTAAYTEAYLLTKKPEYAAFVFEMNDWLLQFQYDTSSGTPADWSGGFASFHDGHLLRTPPTAATGSYAEGLVEACRVVRWIEQEQAAKQAVPGTNARALLYRQAAERSLQFLMRTQYGVGDTPHFEQWYRERIDGAVYASLEDGTVRIDFTQHAICAMFHYLIHVAEMETGMSGEGERE